MIDINITKDEIEEVKQIGFDRSFDWKVQLWTKQLNNRYHDFVLKDM